ncbi:MAG: hypothetical protein AAB316_09695 [Bacteroidota bacterium]
MNSATATAPINLEARKIHLIMKIAQTKDEQFVSYLEDLILEEDTSVPALTAEEWTLVEERLASFQQHPDLFITVEQLEEKLKKMK